MKRSDKINIKTLDGIGENPMTCTGQDVGLSAVEGLLLEGGRDE